MWFWLRSKFLSFGFFLHVFFFVFFCHRVGRNFMWQHWSRKTKQKLPEPCPQLATTHYTTFTHFCLLMLFIIIAKMGGIKSVYSSNGKSDFGTLNFLSGLIFIFLIQPRRELQKMLPIKLKICFDLFYQKIVAVAVTLLSDFCLCLFF